MAGGGVWGAEIAGGNDGSGGGGVMSGGVLGGGASGKIGGGVVPVLRAAMAASISLICSVILPRAAEAAGLVLPIGGVLGGGSGVLGGGVRVGGGNDGPGGGMVGVVCGGVVPLRASTLALTSSITLAKVSRVVAISWRRWVSVGLWAGGRTEIISEPDCTGVGTPDGGTPPLRAMMAASTNLICLTILSRVTRVTCCLCCSAGVWGGGRTTAMAATSGARGVVCPGRMTVGVLGGAGGITLVGTTGTTGTTGATTGCDGLI